MHVDTNNIHAYIHTYIHACMYVSHSGDYVKIWPHIQAHIKNHGHLKDAHVYRYIHPQLMPYCMYHVSLK